MYIRRNVYREELKEGRTYMYTEKDVHREGTYTGRDVYREKLTKGKTYTGTDVHRDGRT